MKKIYRFVDFPVKTTKEEYTRVIKKIVQLHKDNAEIHSLYRFGSIEHHGISDIDYIIVTRGEDATFHYSVPYQKVTQEEKYLLQHYPSAILPQQLFKDLAYLFPVFEIECVYGEDLTKKYNVLEISPEQATIFLADILFTQYPGTFLKLFNKKEISVRKTLSAMHKIRYLVRLFAVLHIKKKVWDNYVKKIQLLRERWFCREKETEEQTAEKIMRLIVEATDIVMQMIEVYHLYYRKRYGLVYKGESISFISRPYTAMFQRNYNSQEALKNMKLSSSRDKRYKAILPLSIGEQLLEYASIKTVFGEYVKKYISIKDEEVRKKQGEQKQETKQAVLNRVRKKRCEVLSELLTYTIKSKYRAGAFSPLHLGYLNHEGFPNKMRDFVWGIMQKTKVKMKNKKHSILLTFDIEECDLIENKEESMSLAAAGTKQVILLLKELNIPTTCFCTYAFFKKFPELVKALQETGAEIALHAYEHADDYKAMPEEETITRLSTAKQAMEEALKTKITGFRGPGFKAPSMKTLAKLEFLYDSSLHPTWVPGYYQNILKSRKVYEQDEVMEVPISVAPFLRLPFSWLWFRNLPWWCIQFCLKSNRMTSDYTLLYFHPWEFVALEKKVFKTDTLIKKVMARNTGEVLEKRLKTYILHTKSEALLSNISFSKLSAYVNASDMDNNTTKVSVNG